MPIQAGAKPRNRQRAKFNLTFIVMVLAAITLSLQLQRTSFDLLDGVDVDIAVHNSSQSSAVVSFAKPDEYELDVYRGNERLWSNLSTGGIPLDVPAHKRQFQTGPTILAIYIWNAIATDGSTPAPGEYTIRARLLGDGISPTASLPVRFINPVPVSALEKLTQGDIVTIAGTLDVAKGVLTDTSGTVTLMRKLLTAPAGATVAVRGYLTTQPDRTRAFYVLRWAVMR
jgi:hypothetical protein